MPARLLLVSYLYDATTPAALIVLSKLPFVSYVFVAVFPNASLVVAI